MVLQGDIILYKDYAFPDETKSDKRFIILNNAQIGSHFLFAITTSQSRHYPSTLSGCNLSKKLFYIPLGNEPSLNKETFVL